MKGEGYMMIDHRAGPGISADMARAIGLPERQLADGGLFEGAILRCTHCPTPYLKNPDRTRERHFCQKCQHYICDNCAALMSQPEYVHRTYREVIDLVQSGKFTITGSAGNPTLIPVIQP